MLQYSGVIVSTVTNNQEGFEFNSTIRSDLEFACFLWVL